MSTEPIELNELLTGLSQKGAKLWVESGQIRIRAPKGVLTSDVRDMLVERKEELLQLLPYGDGASDVSLPQIVPAPEDRYKPFPLNDIQQAYWVGRSGAVELGNITTHAYMEFDSDILDIERFSRAMQKLIDRHDMLRVKVLPAGEQQVSEQVPPYEVKVTDLTGKPPAEVQAYLEETRSEMSHQVLSLDRWHLFDVTATRVDERRVRLHFSIDLIITDFGSLILFVKELSHFYAQPGIPLPPLKITFRDFVLAEQQIQETPLYKRAERYWLDRIDSLPPRPQLPLAINPASIERPRFKGLRYLLAPPTWQRLKQRARQADLTASGILLAAYAEVLTTWSQSSRFTINLTQYNRLPIHPQVNEIIGNSISVTLLAVDNSHDDTFTDRAKRLQKQLWEDLNHTYFNGIRVLRELARRQRHTQGAVMPVVFTSIIGLDLFGKNQFSQDFGVAVYNVSQTPQVWLDYQVREVDGALAVHWDVVEDLFPEGLIDDMFNAYCQLLEQLASGESAWGQQAPQMIPREQLAVREAVNNTDAPIPDDMLHTQFWEQARTQPLAPAVITTTKTLTYGELFESSNRLGHLLRKRGVMPDQPIAVVMKKGWEQIVAVMGILAAGAAYMPVDSEVPAERLEYLLRQIDADFALTQSSLDSCLEWPEGIERLSLDSCDLSWADADPPEIIQTADNLAYVLFTSGSTGQPKGVMLSHRGPLNTVRYFNEQFSVGQGDRALALSALNFDLSVYDIFGMLSAGGALVIPDAEQVKNPEHWAELMSEHRVTVWNSVPTLMKMMVEYLSGEPEKTPHGLRLVVMSGDWIPVDLPDRIKAVWDEAQVVPAGGPTETSIWNICYPLESVDPSWSSIPYGRPIANNRYHVLDERLEHRPDMVPGELFAEGIGLAKGYWRAPETTAEKFITHPKTGKRLYRTGDLGRYLPDGTIEILGRVDFQVKISGYRIELGEIEAALRSHSGVAEAAACAVGQNQTDKRLLAYVVPVEKSLAAHVRPGRDESLASSQAAGESFVSASDFAGDGAGVIRDPTKLIEFKLIQAGLRRQQPEDTVIDLTRREFDESRTGAYLARHTARRFLDEPLPLEKFSRLLDCLEQMTQEHAPIPKRMYPSAGSLYPVQVYLHIKPSRVTDLPSGTYYYDPSNHRLFLLEADTPLSSSAHVETNRAVFEQAAFSIFLVGKLGAVQPVYGNVLARDFCMLEAGYIGQLLMHSASEHAIGICPIGAMDFEPLRGSLGLESDHILLHSLVGGLEATAPTVRTKPVESDEQKQFIQDLQRFLEAKLPAYMVPSSYVLLKSMPVNTNGKIDHRALIEIATTRHQSEEEMLPPATDLERLLADIVKEVLNIESVCVNSNFFDLGANSLNLIQIRNKLMGTLGRSVPIVDLFKRPSISFLAKYLTEEDDNDSAMFEEVQAQAEKRRSERSKRRQSRKIGRSLIDGRDDSRNG